MVKMATTANLWPKNDDQKDNFHLFLFNDDDDDIKR